MISPSADGPADGPGAAIYCTSSSGPSKTCMKSPLFEISCNSIALQRRPPPISLVIQWFFGEFFKNRSNSIVFRTRIRPDRCRLPVAVGRRQQLQWAGSCGQTVAVRQVGAGRHFQAGSACRRQQQAVAANGSSKYAAGALGKQQAGSRQSADSSSSRKRQQCSRLASGLWLYQV